MCARPGLALESRFRFAGNLSMAKKNRNQSENLTSTDGGNSVARLQSPKLAPPRPSYQAAAGEDGLDFVDDILAIGLGLLCILIPRIVTPNIRDLFQLPKQLWMAEGALLLTGLAGILAVSGRPIHWPKTPIVWPFLALIASILLSLTVAPEYTGGVLSIFAKYDVHRWLAAMVLFAVTLMAVSKPRRLWPILIGNLIGGLWVSLIGIGEHHDLLWLQPTEHWAIISKPGSTFGNRNMAAEQIVAVMPATYAILALAVRWWMQNKAARALAIAVPAGLTLMILSYYLKLTVTRSAMIGAVLGLVVAGTSWIFGRLLAEQRRGRAAREAAEQTHQPLTKGRSRLVPLVVALGIGTAAVTGTSWFLVKSGFNTPIDEGDQKRAKSMGDLVKSSFDTHSSAAQWRFGMWSTTWEAIKDHPAGMGAGNWRVIYPQYVTQREKNEMFTIAKQPIRGHQDFLMIWSEYGTQGFLALMALIGLAIYLVVRIAAHHDDGRHARAGDAKGDNAALLAYGAASSLAGIFAICGDALFSFPLQLPAPTFVFALHLGTIGAAEWWLVRRDPDHPSATIPDFARWGLLLLAIAGLVYLKGFNNYEGLHERWLIAEHGFTDGRSLQKRGRPSEGLSAIQTAIKYNPDDFQNHFIEALNYNSMNRSEEAIKSIEASLRLYPNLLNAWVNLAMFNRKQGHEDKMLAAIQAALKLKPDELVTLNTWMQWLEEKGRYQEELEQCRAQIGAFRAADGKGAMPKGRMGYAEYRKTDWPEDDPALLTTYKATLKHAATAARKLSQWEEAAVYYQLLDNEGVPDMPGANEKSKRSQWIAMASDVAEMYGKAGKWDLALPYFKRAAEQAESSRPDLKRVYALAAARQGQYDIAAHELGVALALDANEKDDITKGLELIAEEQPAAKAKIQALLAPYRSAPAAVAPTGGDPKPEAPADSDSKIHKD